MPITLRRRITIIPGFLYLNLNRRSVSVTTAVGPVRHTRSSTGRRTTSVNLPGRGVGYRHTSTAAGRHRRPSDEEAELEARREELRRRMAESRANIRRMRDERRRGR